jgi:L-lactate dehydrogenase complex protein LldG
MVDGQAKGGEMSATKDSRQQVLEQIRAATPGSAASAKQAAPACATLERSYVRRGSMTADARLERMAERLREYDAEVTECEPAGLVAAIAAQLAASGRHAFVVPVGLPVEWLAAGFDWKVDKELPVQEVEHVEGVLTACFCGVAESGTIVLHHSETEGRRVISLLPDWHLCVLRASQIVETLPEYFDRCQHPPKLVTWISGPSATADIEMTRIKGVHGPRFLRVILVRDQDAQSA